MRLASSVHSILPATLFAIVVLPASAEAHIQLTSPPPRYAYDAAGIKIGPCATGTATNMVTHLTAGQPLNVMFNETVAHPGFFRISLNTTGADTFPAISSTPENPVVAPVLADNVLFHASGGGGPRMFTVTVPNVSCAKCTLQLTQFMSDNPTSGYYQCADVTIDSSADGGAGPGSGGASGGGTGGSNTGTGGSGCSYTGGQRPSGGAGAALALGLLGLCLLRRRPVTPDARRGR